MKIKTKYFYKHKSDWPFKYLAAAIIWLMLLQQVNEGVSKIVGKSPFFLGLLLLLMEILTYRIKLWKIYIPVAVLLCGLMNTVFVGELNFPTLVAYTIPAVGVCIYLSEAKDCNLIFWYLNCGSMAFGIIFWYVYNGRAYNLFYNSTKNYVSVLLTIILFILTAVITKAGKKVPLIIVAFYFAGCILGYSRSGIICAMIYICMVIFDRIKPETHLTKAQWIRKIFFWVLVIGGVFYVAMNLSYVLENYFTSFVTVHEGVGNGLADNGRWTAISGYFKSLFTDENTASLFLGIQSKDLLAVDFTFRDNLHNSYLTMHSKLGLLPVVLFVSGMIGAVISSLKMDKKDFAFITIVFILRSFSDFVFPNYIGDIVLYYCIYSYGDYLARNRAVLRKSICFHMENY